MRSFAELFTGRDDVYGVYRLPKNAIPQPGVKFVGAAQTLREPAFTPDLYDKHIAGQQGLGIVPIRLDGTVMWFALDVDNYEDGLHPRLLAKIVKQGLPLVVTTTKSGGAHCWCFLSVPIQAAKAREVAKAFLKKLDLPETTEIFPKQNHIKKTEDGSWINLPYFGDERWCVGEDGNQHLSLSEFLEYANARIVSPEDLKVKTREKVEAEGDDDQTQAPPCIQTMSQDGVEEGRRNDSLTQVAIYLRRAFSDDWESKLKEWNEAHVTPKMTMDELARIIGSARKKDYQYLCTRFSDICQKDKCLKLKYGVGSGGSGATEVIFDRLEWVDGEQPFFRITMGNTTFTAKPEQLGNFIGFRYLVLGQAGILLDMRKQAEWDQNLGALLAMKESVNAPADTQVRERVINKFQQWCGQSCGRDDMFSCFSRLAPYFDGGTVYFKGDDYMRIADRVFPGITRAQVFVILRDWGVMQQRVQINGKSVDVWAYPVTGKVPEWLEFKKEGM